MKKVIARILLFVVICSIASTNAFIVSAETFDADQYPHPYSKVIYDTIQKTKLLPYKLAGYGILYDIDDNGTDELILVYGTQRNTVSTGIPEGRCSVYTMQNRQAVPLISDFVLHVMVAAQMGICGVAEKGGTKYLFIENESSMQGYSSGFWDVYSVSGDKIDLVLESDFECKKDFGEIIHSSSFATINDKQYSYIDYLSEKEKYTVVKNVKSSSNSEDVMTLEELLEYSKSLPIEDEVDGIKIGDANSDGKVNVKDATEIQKAVAGLLTLDERENRIADVDSNSKVNVKDATAIQKHLAGIETGFPIGKEMA